MNNRWLLLVLVLIFFVGIVVFIYQQQQILNNEMKNIKTPVHRIAPIEVAQPAEKPRVKRGTLPKIDPANDPLAPVAMKPKKADPLPTKEEPKRTFDFIEPSPILTQ